MKLEIEIECKAHSERIMWTALIFMCLQAGFFARLTWWEYSWDIMEPITYFATFATAIASFAYYLYTKQVCSYFYYCRKISFLEFFH